MRSRSDTRRPGTVDAQGHIDADQGVVMEMTKRPPGAGIAADRAPLAGLLLIQAFVGYEWLMSGLTKLYRGGFPAGLADELAEKSQGAPRWFESFLDGSIIPNATAFGYLIEIGELLVGLALIGAAAVWLVCWKRLRTGGKATALLVTAVASLGAIVMNVSFHLTNGSPHPWFIPRDGFDEGVDLDSLLPFIELALVFVSVALLRSLHDPACDPARRAAPRAPDA